MTNYIPYDVFTNNILFDNIFILVIDPIHISELYYFDEIYQIYQNIQKIKYVNEQKELSKIFSL